MERRFPGVRWGAQLGRRSARGGNYGVFFGMLPDGTAPVVWTEGTSPADIAADLTTILDHGVPSTGGPQ